MEASYFISEEVIIIFKQSIIITLLLPSKKFYLTHRQNDNIVISKYLPCDEFSSSIKEKIKEWWLEGGPAPDANTKQELKQLIQNILYLNAPGWTINDLSGVIPLDNLPDIEIC